MFHEKTAAESSELLPLWLRVPDGFHTIDLETDPHERMDAHFESLSLLSPSASREQLVAGVLSFEAALVAMLREGLVHVSSFALRTDADELLTGLCQIYVLDRPSGDSNLYAHSVLEAYPAADSGLRKGIVSLPAGLAAVVVKAEQVTAPGSFFDVPTDISSDVCSVTFQMAFPHVAQAVAITLSTENFEALEDFLELATVVAAGTSFTAPPHASTSQERPVASAHKTKEDIRRTFG